MISTNRIFAKFDFYFYKTSFSATMLALRKHFEKKNYEKQENTSKKPVAIIFTNSSFFQKTFNHKNSIFTKLTLINF